MASFPLKNATHPWPETQKKVESLEVFTVLQTTVKLSLLQMNWVDEHIIENKDFYLKCASKSPGELFELHTARASPPAVLCIFG